ncbi:MAG: DMT family transporter [Rhodospirillales bacterium]
MNAPAPANALRGIMLMLATMFVFVVIDALAKHLTADLPVMQVVWARNVFALAFSLLLLRGRGVAMLRATRRPGLQLARSAFQFVSTAIFFTALYYIPLADAIAIGFVSPLVLTALSVPLLGEKVGPRRWAAVAAGFLGVLVIIRPGFGQTHWAMLLPLAMAFTSAFYNVLTRILAGEEHPMTTLWYTTLVGSVLTSAIMPFQWVAPGPAGWALMALLGAAGGVGHFLLIKAFSHAPASMLAPFNYSQMIWSIPIGYLVFGDLPDLYTLAGAAIIAASGIYTAYRERVRREQRLSPHA